MTIFQNINTLIYTFQNTNLHSSILKVLFVCVILLKFWWTISTSTLQNWMVFHLFHSSLIIFIKNLNPFSEFNTGLVIKQFIELYIFAIMFRDVTCFHTWILTVFIHNCQYFNKQNNNHDSLFMKKMMGMVSWLHQSFHEFGWPKA